jgi:GGDEF domain-containing protein
VSASGPIPGVGRGDATTTWFWAGERAAVRAALTAALGAPPVAAATATAAAGDLVVVDAAAAATCFADLVAAGLVGGHAFAAVRWLERRGCRVYVVVDEGDQIGPELARFCLARGALRWQPETAAIDVGELGPDRGAAGRPSITALLQRVERELARSGEVENTVERLLRFERDHSPLERLQDPETGLFDGPYATWKIDEEWKRAMRFHQPLSLLLLDLGPGFAALAPAARRAVLADAASVFLNECRDIDVLARFLPSTFLFLLPGTGSEGAVVVARRMLDALAQRLAAVSGLAPAAGIATVPARDIPDRKALLLVAEACLRRAQSHGGASRVATTWQ